jgi:alpha-galactosidase
VSRRVRAALVGAALVASGAAALIPQSAAAHAPRKVRVAATPPMGWSSWSALRKNFDQSTIEDEAQVMHDQLRRYGYQYVNLDAGWSDHLDGYGRDAPDPAKFPDGIKPLAAYVHHLGLKLGLYLVPGIPKAAVDANLPIAGTPYHAKDIADTTTEGNTLSDAWRIDYTKPGAARYVQSRADLFASWGVDYLKMDFVGPGGGNVPADNRADIAHWHAALAKTGRPIHLELSNSLSFDAVDTWQNYSNGWRIDGDVECYSKCPGVLTNWDQRVVKRFSDVPKWVPYAGPGHWNDLDSVEVGNGATDGLTPDERQSVMTLWSIEAAPLLLGTDLRHLDPADLPLITNRQVIAVDQAGVAAHPLSQATPQQVWVSKQRDGSYVVALFNLASAPATVATTWDQVGLPGPVRTVRDLWQHCAVAHTSDGISATVPAHGSRLLRVVPAHR